MSAPFTSSAFMRGTSSRRRRRSGPGRRAGSGRLERSAPTAASRASGAARRSFGMTPAAASFLQAGARSAVRCWCGRRRFPPPPRRGRGTTARLRPGLARNAVRTSRSAGRRTQAALKLNAPGRGPEIGEAGVDGDVVVRDHLQGRVDRAGLERLPALDVRALEREVVVGRVGRGRARRASARRRAWSPRSSTRCRSGRRAGPRRFGAPGSRSGTAAGGRSARPPPGAGRRPPRRRCFPPARSARRRPGRRAARWSRRGCCRGSARSAVSPRVARKPRSWATQSGTLT